MSSDSGLGVYFHPASTSCRFPLATSTCSQQRATYLLGLAFPSPLSVVRPPAGESRLPRFNHGWLAGVLLRIVANLSFDSGNYGPTAVAGVRQMLLERVVACLPAVQALLAQEACDIVGILWAWVEEETSVGELARSQQSIRGEAVKLAGHIRSQVLFACVASSALSSLVRWRLSRASLSV